MIEVASLGEQIERQLKQEIFSGRFKPGQQIPVQEFAAECGISVTPVRDALKRLDSAGFVRIAPRKGVYVATPTAAAFREISELRTALECLAVRSAATRIPESELRHALTLLRKDRAHPKAAGKPADLREHDALVHDLIVAHCNNSRLQAVMRDLCDHLSWARTIVVQRLKSPYRRSLPEHIEVLEALLARDARMAERALRAHLERAARETLEALTTQEQQANGGPAQEPEA